MYVFRVQLAALSVGLVLAQVQAAFGAPAASTPAPTQKAAPKAPPLAPAIQKPKLAPMPTTAPPSAPTTIDRASAQKAAQVAELEQLMFGAPNPAGSLGDRLDKLETAVFHSTNPDWEASKRIDRLLETLVGTGSGTGSTAAPYPPNALPSPNAAVYPPQMPYDPNMAPTQPAYGQPIGGMYSDPGEPQAQPVQHAKVAMPPAPDVDSPEFTRELSRIDAEKFALELVNEIRAFNGLPSLAWDDVAYKVAQQHVADLCARSTVSHNNSKGENPDVRYTKAGGSDCVVEGLISMKSSGRVPMNKAIVYQVVKELFDSQDDRDALMSAYSTQFAFSCSNNSRNDKLLAVTEVVTDIADLEAVPAEVKVGDKIDIKGTIKGPYRFSKISLAWEGLAPSEGGTTNEEEQEEALPYFPPLDYTAYARKTEHDTEKLQRVAQWVGLGAVLAGSLFVPPVALAAPLIMAAPTRVKPVSEIPIKGGVKVNGNNFEFKAQLSKDNKEGIYYVTVWVEADGSANPVAISRRAIIARPGEPETASKGDDKKRELLTVVEKSKQSDESKGSDESK